jgi:hypothetical protein
MVGVETRNEILDNLISVFGGLKREDVLISPFKLQNDNYNCGPWVISILTKLVETRGQYFVDDMDAAELRSYIENRRCIDEELILKSPYFSRRRLSSSFSSSASSSPSSSGNAHSSNVSLGIREEKLRRQAIGNAAAVLDPRLFSPAVTPRVIVASKSQPDVREGADATITASVLQ